MLGGLKQFARPFVPASIRREWSARKSVRKYGGGEAEQVFRKIYEENLWGSEAGFYSGPGSDDTVTADFVRVVNELIAARGVASVVDVGCGDFRTGRRIARPGLNYVGVDIFPGLVEQHQERYGREGLSFVCADATKDELPDGELCMIREVLQHLSNADIQRVLTRAKKFPLLVIAESHPAPGMMKKPNLDKATGGDTRVFFDSGVVVSEPPFSLPNVTVLARTKHSLKLVRKGEEIVTYLVEQYS